MLELSSADLELLKSKGISVEQIENQIANFKIGFPFAKIDRPATHSDGIIVLDENGYKNGIEFYNKHSQEMQILKFVPASGAASRMFKHLFEFRELLNQYSYDSLIENSKYKLAKEFFSNIDKFAFYNDLSKICNDKFESISTNNAKIILDSLLGAKGLNYASLPKALLKFHSYDSCDRLAIEEHLMEAIQYGISKENYARIHFTVSPEHQSKFNEILSEIVPLYEKKYSIKFEIQLSNQKPSTDTIAVDISNNVFRDNGNLFFRPGGHGALIENLNELDADMIFIKNIDNVVRDEKRQPTIDYKKSIASYGIHLKNEIDNLLKLLEQGEGVNLAIEFITNKLNLNISEQISELDEFERLDYLFDVLNRPLRVCGMVKNVGEPGGGPFWVDKNGEIRLQIVESVEIDQNNPKQLELMKQSTHFNPVDLVCFTKDYKGQKYDLKEFVDNNSAFISEKSKDGKTLKAMELPGLWNGAMAFWNTIFMEVPIDTFSPVKTVNDLLRDSHIKLS
jgi:hypothetical protein